MHLWKRGSATYANWLDDRFGSLTNACQPWRLVMAPAAVGCKRLLGGTTAILRTYLHPDSYERRMWRNATRPSQVSSTTQADIQAPVSLSRCAKQRAAVKR